RDFHVTGVQTCALPILLRRFRPAPESIELPHQQQRQNDFDHMEEERSHGDTLAHYRFVPRIIMQWLFPVILTFAIYLLMRGHDLPGGGFAGGVAASIAILLLYMAGGTRWVETRLDIRPLRWISFGLLLAVGTGLAAWVAGYPFLTSYFSYLTIPLVCNVPMASALLFDIGVFAVVVGTTVLILIALAHQSIRSPLKRKADDEPQARAPEGGV